MSQTALDCRAVTFSVEATGSNLRFQWFRDEAAVAGATNAAYTIRRASFQDNGSVFAVEVSNEHGSVRSSNAVLYVSQDPNVVLVRCAYGSNDQVTIFVQFSTVVTNGNNPYNYSVFSATNGNFLEVESANYIGGGDTGEFVALRLNSATPMIAGSAYNLTAGNIFDECGNVTDPSTVTPILVPVRLRLTVSGSQMGEITWTGTGALQVATNLVNPHWETLTNAVSPYGPFPLTGNRFFRVRVW